MISRYLINHRGSRYAEFEKARLWISLPAELWLINEGECALLMSTSPAISTTVTAHFSETGNHNMLSIQVCTVFQALALGVGARLFNLSQSENLYMDEVFAVFNMSDTPNKLKNGTASRETIRRARMCQLHFEVPKEQSKFLLRICFW
jgi:hypothetical protein